jgi:dUTP pyrophosphatase
MWVILVRLPTKYIMVTIQVKNIEGLNVIPIEGSKVAAGYDIIAVKDPIIVGETITKEGEFFPFYSRIDYIEYHTELYISPQSPVSSVTYTTKDKYHTLLHPRSSVRKYNLVLANSIGLIDNDYRGEIIFCFKYIWQPEDYILEYQKIITNENGESSEPTGRILGKLNRDKIYKSGDKIGQLVAELTNPIEFKLVTELDATERGEGGFGSTDKPKITIKEEIIEIKSPMIKTINEHIEETKSSYGTIVDQYQKVGGVSVKKKYSEEIKERDNK